MKRNPYFLTQTAPKFNFDVKKTVITFLLAASLPLMHSQAASAFLNGDSVEQSSSTQPAALPLLSKTLKPEETPLGEKLAQMTTPAVVRIVDGYVGKIYWPGSKLRPTAKTYAVSCGGSGSGFFISSDGYIVTNAHVAQMSHLGESKGKQCLVNDFLQQLAKDVGFNVRDDKDLAFVLDQLEFENFKAVNQVITADGESRPFEVKEYGAPAGTGKDVAILKVQIVNAPVLLLGNSEAVHLQDHVTALGYPAAAESDLLSAKSQDIASITDGKISAIKQTKDGSTVLQISAPVTHGNSGGPILNDQGQVIGIVTFGGDPVNGQEISGFSFGVTSNTIQEFVKQAGVVNALGVADQLYQEGLTLFWNKRYSKARKQFEEVKQLYPQHPTIDTLIRQSIERIDQEKSELPLWPFPLGAASLLGGGIAYAVRQRKLAKNVSTSMGGS